jgi:hypothetical protein
MSSYKPNILLFKSNLKTLKKDLIMEEQKVHTIFQMINELNFKYTENSYMIQRLETHLFNLPNTLEQENKKYDERVSRFNELTLEQDNFYKVFLSKHQYFYMPYNSIYYEYDGKTYKIIKDDNIHYQLLSTITDEGKLIQWKHKTKQNIIKKIKERTLFKSTPETYTIQNVLGFLQTMFHTKTEAKYFLTIIGECILKKNNDNLLYFVSSNLKKFIILIDSIVYVTTGNSIMNNFITKYHDTHKLNLYRLIKTNETTNVLSFDIVKGVLNNIGIDILCVATHYYERYTNTDNYLNTKDEDDIKNYVLYFVYNPLEKILDDFVNQCIEKVNIESTISWKSMHYIWKLYLSSINLPNMIYLTQLQILLSSKIENINENGNVIFINVTSKYLPSVSSFISFWDKYITITNDTNNDDEYEIDELITLYKMSDQKNTQLSDINMIKMICHYFNPQVEVIDNKYVTNIKCNLWSKHDDINDFLQSYKFNINSNFTNLLNSNIEIISFNDLYQSYKMFFKAKGTVDQKIYLIVSKHFFEKYITNKLTNFIKFETFVSSEWLKQ